MHPENVDRPSGREPSLRRRLIVGQAMVLGIGFVLMYVSATTEHFVFHWVFPVILIGGLYVITLRCPRCGTRIIEKRSRVGGVEVIYVSPGIPKTCSSCGADIP